MSWVRQHPMKGTKTLNRALTPQVLPKPLTKIALALQPGDQRGEPRGGPDPGKQDRLYMKRWVLWDKT